MVQRDIKIFAPTVKHISIKTLLYLVVNLDLELEQMDMKTVFLIWTFGRRVVHKGFESKIGQEKVGLLKKYLYRLKQSPVNGINVLISL